MTAPRQTCLAQTREGSSSFRKMGTSPCSRRARKFQGSLRMTALWRLPTKQRASFQVERSMFAPGDGSDYDRLRLLSNRIKHFDEDVERAAQAGAESIPIAPIWIT